MPGKVLSTGSRTVTGRVRIPNGSGSGSATSQASALLDLTFCGVHFQFYSDTGAGYGMRSSFAPIVRASADRPSPGPPIPPTYIEVNYNDSAGNGRGISGDYIEGTFSVTVGGSLVLYETSDSGDLPEDAYPDYGGAKTVGEFPGTHGKLVWESNTNIDSVAVSLGGRSASASLINAAYGESVSIGALLYDDSWFASDGCPITVHFDGVPVDMPTGALTRTWYGKHDGISSNPEEFAGSMALSSGAFELKNRGWIRSSVLEATYIAASATLYVPTLGNVVLDAYAMDAPYPDSCEWTLIHKWAIDPPGGNGGRSELVPVIATLEGQAVTFNVKQGAGFVDVPTLYNKSITRTEDSGGWTPYHGYWPPGTDGPTVYSFASAIWEFGPVQGWIAPPAGEDPKDWRVGFRGKASGGINVARVAPVSVTLPAPTVDGGTGDCTYAFDPPSIWEGFRFADVVSPEAGADEIDLGGKAYDVAPEALTTVDLCFPKAPGVSIDRMDTRYPLDALRRSTVDSALWGKSVVTSIVAKGGPIDSVSLRDGTAPVKVHFLAPFGPPWEQEVPDDEIESGGDTYTVEHYCARLAIGDAGGRQAFEAPHVRKTVNNAPGRLWTTDYTHLPCSAVATLINETPGWNAAAVADAWGGIPPAWWVGQGYVKAGGTWSKQWDQSPGTIAAQPVYDSLEWRDQIGDVFDVGAGGGAALGLVGRKVFRGSAYGSTQSEATVFYSAIDGDPSGSVTTAGKRYLCGPTLEPYNDWGRVWVDPAHKASFGGYPRRVERGAFAVVVAGGKVLALGVHPSRMHGRMIGAGETAAIGTTIARPFVWLDTTTDAPAEWGSVAWRLERANALYTFSGDKAGTSATFAKTADQGRTLEPVATIAGAVRGAVQCGSDGLVRLAYAAGSGAVTIRTYDADVSTHAERSAGVSDASDKALALRQTSGRRGGNGLALLWIDGAGAVKLAKASGDDPFSAPVTVASGAAVADFDIDSDGRTFVYWIEEGSGTLKGRLYAADGAAGAAFATNVTDADGKGLAVARSIGDRGEARTSLLYTIEGADPAFKVSDSRGQTFGT